MKSQQLIRWMPLMCLVLVVIAGITMKHQHSKLISKNNSLILQNDSILSVNLQLSKEISKLQFVLDSLRMKNTSASRMRLTH